MKKNILTQSAVMMTIIGLTSCSSLSTTTPANQLPAAPGMYHTALWEGNAAETWDNLQHHSVIRLTAMRNAEKDPVRNSWIELALISKHNSVNTQKLAHELAAWRERNPSHPANQLLPDTATLNQLQNSPQPKQIAVLLPQHGIYGSAAQAVRDGFMNAYYANFANIGNQNIRFYDTNGSKNMSDLYQQAIADGADFVIGPLVKDNVSELTSTSTFKSPTLALNYTPSNSLPSNFYEFGLLPEDEVMQIADRARLDGRQHAIIIAPQNAWGKRLASAFSTRWQADGGKIQETYLFADNADFNQEIAHLLHVDPTLDKKLMKENNNKTVLEQQRRQDFDVIFLLTKTQEAHSIVPLLHYYYANNVPIYAISSVYSGKPNPTKDGDLNGVIVCDIPWNMKATHLASHDETSSDRLYAVGQDTYLLSQTLARLEKLPNFPIYGTTGALTLSSTHQIHRRIPCVPVQNGLI